MWDRPAAVSLRSGTLATTAAAEVAGAAHEGAPRVQAGVRPLASAGGRVPRAKSGVGGP